MSSAISGVTVERWIRDRARRGGPGGRGAVVEFAPGAHSGIGPPAATPRPSAPAGAGSRCTREALMGPGPDAYDVVVVGAGISGLTTAYWLKKLVPHLRVLVLERS